MIRIVSAFLDKDAQKAPEAKPLDWLKISLPTALACVSTVTGPLHDLVKDYALVDTIIRAIVPGALCAVCFAVVVLRRRRPSLAGFVPGEFDPNGYEYSFDQPVRRTAKYSAPALLLLTLLAFARLVPTVGERDLSAYVCAAVTNEPVTRGTIQPVDVFGLVGASPMRLDSSGW